MYRYRRGTQISLSRCFLASALAWSRKLFPELFRIVMEFQYSNSIPHRRRRCWTIFEDIVYIFLFFRIISRTIQSILLLFLPSFAEFFSDQFSSTLLLSAWRQKSPEQHFPRDSRRSRRTSRQSFEVSSWIFLARVNFPPPPAPPCSNVVESFFFSFPRNTWARVVACV